MFLLPGFLPVDFLINSVFGGVLALLFIPSMISFGFTTLGGLLQLIFPGQAPVMPAAM